MRGDDGGWTPSELRSLGTISSPMRIQLFLSGIGYDPDHGTRSPRWVLHNRRAHCFEGALFAAAALRHLGHPPLIVDLRAVNDDDHVIAVFRRNGCWGAIAKSNYTTLRYREPIYRSLRELAMSYFDLYFNCLGEKSLRECSLPLDLSRFDADGWMTSDANLDYIGDAVDRHRHFRLLTRSQVRALEPVDPCLVESGMRGSLPEGLYKPRVRRPRRAAAGR